MNQSWASAHGGAGEREIYLQTALGEMKQLQLPLLPSTGTRSLCPSNAHSFRVNTDACEREGGREGRDRGIRAPIQAGGLLTWAQEPEWYTPTFSLHWPLPEIHRSFPTARRQQPQCVHSPCDFGDTKSTGDPILSASRADVCAIVHAHLHFKVTVWLHPTRGAHMGPVMMQRELLYHSLVLFIHEYVYVIHLFNGVLI